MKKLFVSFVILLGLQAASASAQNVVYEGCRDFRGIAVASQKSKVNNVAIAAWYPNKMPVIYWNPNVLSTFHPVTRYFWYLHECGHHVLAHAMGTAHPYVREKQADCWAIKTMKMRGELTPQRLNIIKTDLSKLPGDGWVYLPGPQRAIFVHGYCANL